MNPTRILIVEDELIVALDVRGALVDLGYDVVGIAASCPEALTQAAALHPDLVLMDVRLEGGTDGIATAALLRERHAIPVVYLTANSDPTTLGRALADAPGGFLIKPFHDAALHAAIEVALRREEAEARRLHGQEALAAELRREREVLAAQNQELQRESRTLGQQLAHLHEDAIIDPLTGLHNRRHLDLVLARELHHAQRAHYDLGVIVADVDQFKTINDTLGHAAGDLVLARVAEVLREGVRPYDSLFRYGGDELVILAPGAAAPEACALAERLRAAVGRIAAPAVTVSFGVASALAHGAAGPALLKAADDALYAAKAAGRNCVVMAPPRAE